MGTMITNNLTTLYFSGIVITIPEKYALHLIYSHCFLKEINL